MAALSADEQAVLDQFKTEGEDDENASEGNESDSGSGETEAPAEGADAPASGGEQASGTPEGDEGTDEEVPVTSVRVGDRDIPVEDVQALLEFQQWANQNPDKMTAFGQYLRGEAELVVRQQQAAAEAAAQQQQQAPAEIDWDMVDPAVKTAYEAQAAQIAEVNQRLEGLQNPIAAWQSQQVEEANRQALDQIQQATSKVNEKLGLDLSEKEIEELQRTTAGLNILPGLRQSIADPVEAVATALEMAVWQTPQFRDKIVAGQVASERANDKRDLAGRVGGTSGSERSGVASSATAADVKKMTKEERQSAMAAEIAESMRGTA